MLPVLGHHPSEGSTDSGAWAAFPALRSTYNVASAEPRDSNKGTRLRVLRACSAEDAALTRMRVLSLRES